MLIAGRTITRMATGALLSIMPAYISETSRRNQRALLVGDLGVMEYQMRLGICLRTGFCLLGSLQKVKGSGGYLWQHSCQALLCFTSFA
jgi:hypothetical protein